MGRLQWVLHQTFTDYVVQLNFVQIVACKLCLFFLTFFYNLYIFKNIWFFALTTNSHSEAVKLTSVVCNCFKAAWQMF